MSAEDVKSMKFKNRVTGRIVRWLTGPPHDSVLDAGPLLRSNCVDIETQLHYDDEDHSELDLHLELADRLQNDVSNFIAPETSGKRYSKESLTKSLLDFALAEVYWGQVAEAVLKHDNLWDDYLLEQAEREEDEDETVASS